MDLTTLIGIIMALGLCLWGIGPSKIGNFIDPQSLAIVIGGTIAAVTASYPFRILMDVPKHITVLFRGKKYNIPKLVDQLVDLAMIARQSGLLALDDMMARHDEAAGLYEKASSYAPAFGMIGTLIGLINMLKGLNLDGGGGASSLGADMSVALITTFYGSGFANIFCQPIAKKLRVRQAEEELYCTTVVEGLMGIQAGENPKMLREHLLSCMKQSQQKKLLLKAEKAGGGGGEA